jgi:hypothetical protein
MLKHLPTNHKVLNLNPINRPPAKKNPQQQKSSLCWAWWLTLIILAEQEDGGLRLAQANSEAPTVVVHT